MTKWYTQYTILHASSLVVDALINNKVPDFLHTPIWAPDYVPSTCLLQFTQNLQEAVLKRSKGVSCSSRRIYRSSTQKIHIFGVFVPYFTWFLHKFNRQNLNFKIHFFLIILKKISKQVISTWKVKKKTRSTKGIAFDVIKDSRR